MQTGFWIRSALRKVFIAVLAFIALSACSGSAPCYSDAEPPSHSIYVIRRAWHTGIAVPASEWPDRDWPLLADFPEAGYLEFGWGDAVYYQAKEPTLSMGLGAALWPSASVIEVIGLKTVSMVQTSDYEAVEVRISDAGLRALAASIAGSFAGDRITPTGITFRYAEGQSRFYHARGKFYFPRMCNHWTAERLKAASCPIQPWSVIFASRVMREARGFAQQPHPSLPP